MWKELRNEIIDSFDIKKGIFAKAEGGQISAQTVVTLETALALAACGTTSPDTSKCVAVQCNYDADYEYYKKDPKTDLVNSEPEKVHEGGIVGNDEGRVSEQHCPPFIRKENLNDPNAISDATIVDGSCEMTPRR